MPKMIFDKGGWELDPLKVDLFLKRISAVISIAEEDNIVSVENLYAIKEKTEENRMFHNNFNHAIDTVLDIISNKPTEDFPF